jgi:hypothetical protein
MFNDTNKILVKFEGSDGQAIGWWFYKHSDRTNRYLVVDNDGYIWNLSTDEITVIDPRYKIPELEVILNELQQEVENEKESQI